MRTPSRSTSSTRFLVTLCTTLVSLCGQAQDKPAPSPQLAALNAYFEQQVAALEGQLERDIKTKEDWLGKKDEYRRQLAEMLGLDPMPPRTDLKATKTGEFEHEGIVVENLHFQSMPGLYVTANLYRPKIVEKPLPTVLYVCGHANKMKDGVSYGNKAGYEHHGVWYAKHGFVCLVIDTVQLGEIRGEHHGTYSKGRMWWFSRGYTPAGVEAWAGMRALDYLETRPEVDKTRFGVAGRSGGGAYSWWIAALDERIKAAAPTAGITTLRNHVVDGCVEGHCDCMFMVNTYRWDYDKVAALVAPRPLCIVNTDKDGIFPIDGVFKIYQSTRRIYKLLGAEQNIGLQVAEGPHKDTQPLNTGEFHWMMRFLQGMDRMATTDSPMVKGIPMEKLRVFPVGGTGSLPVGVTGSLPGKDAAVTGKLPVTPTGWQPVPQDERNTTIDESFVAKAADAKVPENAAQWREMSAGWMKGLREKCFAGWIEEPLPFREYVFRQPGQPKIWGRFVRNSLASHHEAIRTMARAQVSDEDSNPFGNPDHVTKEFEQAVNAAMRYILAVDDEGSGDGLKAQRHLGVTHDVPTLDIYLIHRADLKPQDLELIALHVLDAQGWQDFVNTFAPKFPGLFPKDVKVQPDAAAFESEKKMHESFKWGMAYVCPRGIGPTAWDVVHEGGKMPPLLDKKAAAAAEKARVQRLRRFYLLGQTLEGQQVWDIRCAVRALRSIEGLKDTKLWLTGNRTQAANVLYASLFEDGIARIDLHELPHSHMPLKPEKGSPLSGDEPAYLNVLKILDIPQAAAMAAERTRVVIYDDDKAAWSYPQQVSEKFGWGADKKAGLQLREVPKAEQ